MGCPARLLARAGLMAAALAVAGPAAAEEAGEEPAGRDLEPYHIGVEDQLRIVIYNEPELSGVYTVRPDGKITVPLVNDVHVLGETTDRVKERITQALSTILREPNVTVIADEINSYRVYFLGEVRNPGAVQFYRRTRLLQAIATAGGPTEFAKNSITLVREVGAGEQRLQIDYKRLLAGDPGQPNLVLAPGDTLIFN